MKTSGEGPKTVRDVFKQAARTAPSIIFIDEVDAIGGKRVDSNSSGEQEVQRTMIELLGQLVRKDFYFTQVLNHNDWSLKNVGSTNCNYIIYV